MVRVYRLRCLSTHIAGLNLSASPWRLQACGILHKPVCLRCDGGACCCVCTVGILFISMQRGRPMPVIPEHAQFVQKQTIRLRRRAGLCNVKCCTHLIIIIRCEEMQIKPLLGNELCAISARRMQIQVCYLISGYLEVSYCITYIVSLNIQ